MTCFSFCIKLNIYLKSCRSLLILQRQWSLLLLIFWWENETALPLPLYVETAPTVAEMLEASLKILRRDPDGFFVVVEEEGTDNFANSNNAVGTIEAMRRADAAIGVAMDYVNTQDPNTLVVTAADSDAGGMQVFQFAPHNRPSGNFDPTNPNLESQPEVPFINVNPTTVNKLLRI